MSERGDSWCTDSSFSSLLVKLSQVFESAFLDSILKLAVIPVDDQCYVPDVKKGWYRNIYVRQLLLEVVQIKEDTDKWYFHSQKSLLVALRKNTYSYKN